MKLLYALVLYNIKHREYCIAIDTALLGLKVSSTFEDSTTFRKFVSLFKSISHCATETQEEQFNLIMSNTLKRELINEKNIFFDSKWYFELVFQCS